MCQLIRAMIKNLIISLSVIVLKDHSRINNYSVPLKVASQTNRLALAGKVDNQHNHSDSHTDTFHNSKTSQTTHKVSKDGLTNIFKQYLPNLNTSLINQDRATSQTPNVHLTYTSRYLTNTSRYLTNTSRYLTKTS